MAYMQRKLDDSIRDWAKSGDDHPLLIRGARRTGKTTLVEHVAPGLFGNMVKLDLQTDLATIERIFDVPTDDVEAIVRRIREYTGRPCEAGSTVLFLDEIQLSEKALNSLRFFSGTPWRVIATGSLLGVTVKKRRLPFPSGVRQVELRPMDFEEFLWALGKRSLADAIRERTERPESFILHERALDLYHRYLTVGGMPRAVAAYRDTGSFEEVAREQREIDETYVNDMTAPDNGISGVAAKRIWDSLPAQLMRSSTKKFKYADVMRGGGRREKLLEPLEWLAAAGIVNRNDMTHDIAAPLTPYSDDEGSFFKVYVADTGVMFSKFNIDARLFLNPDTARVLSSDFRGALAENCVMQALRANGIRTFYWTPSGGQTGELDFVFQDRAARVVPVEVKSARNVTAKSLRRFVREARSPKAYRLSERDFGIDVVAGTDVPLVSLPLYAAFAITDAA
ncbi:ATP-binding protein [Bifidobacterium avesanii]|uniref:AAA family ATPase n=1 Tax=Bifidobacterium avesanii TaxID=1798157 RepID=A0A7K3TKH0_9BIFI|nr:ATP-binding protein [Bifidobacterium avesanii]KAB8288887.1 ATPase [Bifidobacterium avesanii]NEG79164.1 AAA family ATPase [Bifidobacterium avesanii]